MQHFQKICAGIDVLPLLRQVEAHPDLWNEHRNRTGFKGSPFTGTSDIWLRYRIRSELVEASDFKVPHFSSNYPAWHILSAAQDIAFDLMRTVRGVHLGGVLMTKIPPGVAVKPHDDRGSWHAETMNCKIYVPIMANEDCINYCGDDALVIRAGEAVSFDNLVTHSVENNGATDRITLIVCFKVDRD